MKTVFYFGLTLKNLSLVIVLALGCAVRLVGQRDTVPYTVSDTAYANRLILDSYKLQDERKYEKSILKLDTAGQIFLQTVGENSTEYATVLHGKAYAFEYQYRLDTAIVLNQEVISIRVSILGPEHLDVAKSYTNLGNCYLKNGNHNQAIEFHGKSLAIRLKVHGPEHPDVASSYNNLGVCFKEKGDCNQAIEYYEKSLIIRLKKLGPEDLDVARSYNNLGGCFRQKGNYNQAIEFHEKTLAIRLKKLGPEHQDVARSYNNLGNCFLDKGDYDRAIEFYEKAKTIHLKVFNVDSPNLTTLYVCLGECYRLKGDYKLANDYHEKALAIRLKAFGAEHTEVADSYQSIGTLLRNLGDYDQAIEFHKKSLTIRLKRLGPGHPDVAHSYASLGNCLLDKGDYDQAIQFHEKGLDIWLKTFGTNHADVAISYNNLGALLFEKGDYDRAIEFYEKSLTIRLKKLGLEHPEVADSYNNLGNVFWKKNNFDQAIEYQQKALAIVLKTFGQEHPTVSRAYNNLGGCYFAKGEYDLAIEFFEKSLVILAKTFGLEHPSVADIYNNFGNCFFKKGNSDRAIEYHERSLSILLKTFGSKHSIIARSYNNLGYCFRSKGDYGQALIYLQKALTANVYDKGLDSVLSNEQLLETLEKIGSIYLKNREKKNLNLAASTYREAREAMHRYRQSITRSSSKLRIASKFLPVYEGSIAASLTLFKETGDTSQLRAAFEAAELGKGIILYEAIKARHFAGIPDDSLEIERQFQVDIAFYDRRRLEEETKPIAEKKDSLVALWGAKVFEKRRQLDSLLADFDRYPDYKRLKYDFSIVSLDNVRDNFLRSRQTLVEYFLGDSALYIFAVNRQNLKAVRVEKDSLEKMVRDYLKICQDDSSFYEGNRHLPWQLYQKLLLPVQDLLDSSLVIIPDGVLGELPFETLVDVELSHNKPNAYPFLVKKYSITYCYSATLWKEMREKKHRKDMGQTWLGFAPFADMNSIAIKRGTSKPLARGVGKEVADIPGILGYGQAMIGKKALKDTFAHTARNARVVHISSHGIRNPSAEEYTYIAFPHKEDSIDHDSLFVRELYNVQLNADLVVLGTCVSGTGKLARGEGIISLARACAYAGAKSIVTSLWEVNDLATSNLMRFFYYNLKKGMAKDDALRYAKLDILKNPPEAHPYYWAGFIGVGDMSNGLHEK